jgi:hypothetical protein
LCRRGPSKLHVISCLYILEPNGIGFEYTDSRQDQGRPILTYSPPAMLQYQSQLPVLVRASAGTVQWIGPTMAELDEQNRVIASQVGAMRPVQLVPYEPPTDSNSSSASSTAPSPSDRTIMENCRPGAWVQASRYPHYVRHNRADSGHST